jgi:hypothetical protein
MDQTAKRRETATRRDGKEATQQPRICFLLLKFLQQNPSSLSGSLSLDFCNIQTANLPAQFKRNMVKSEVMSCRNDPNKEIGIVEHHSSSLDSLQMGTHLWEHLV